MKAHRRRIGTTTIIALLVPVCLFVLAATVSCSSKTEQTADGGQQPDSVAMREMEGQWMNDDDGVPSFRIVGDSVFFPYDASAPLRFAVIGDTIVMYGANTVKYPIVERTASTLKFLNPTGETVTLTKSEDADADTLLFVDDAETVINQGQTIKRDTVVFVNSGRFHCYMQVNPTTHKVVKSMLNDEGVEVDNIYYDNSVYLAVFEGRKKLYSHEFKKADFAELIPENMVGETILSDITLDKTTRTSIVFNAYLAIPDNPTSYIVNITIGLKDTFVNDRRETTVDISTEQ